MLIFSLIIISIICFCFAIQLQKQADNMSVSFPNGSNSKEEYAKRKKKKIEFAINDFYFWDKLEIPSYEINKNYLKNWICPYCNEKLIEKKGKTFKCPHCKEKVFKKRELTTNEEGLFTIQQKQEIDILWEEYRKRINFLEIFQYIEKIILPEPTLPTIGMIAKEKYTSDKKNNVNELLFALHSGLKSYYTKQEINKLRQCKFFEGEIQKIYGTIEQATNAFMCVLYLDLIGDYNVFFLDSDFTKKELKEMGCNEWDHGFLAPGIYERAFQEDLPLEKFEKIFLFNANSLVENLQFKPPITPQEAWQEILKYREENNKK